MTIEQWRVQAIAVIGKPIPLKQKEQVKINAAINAIRKSFGPKRAAGASTCIEVLNTLVAIAQERGGLEHGVEGLTQYTIARRTSKPWCETTVGRYTREMEKLGLLRIERKYTKDQFGRSKRKRNHYHFTFLESRLARPGGGSIKHPITTSTYLSKGN
jgi:hypothetical protein